MVKLDLKDRKILYELDFNARQTNSQIAKKVGLSREVVNYRIKRLVEEKIIRSFVTLLNNHALGHNVSRIFFKFRSISKNEEKELVKFFKNKAAWLVKVRGYWSFNCIIFTKDFFKLEKFLNSFKKKFKNNLIKTHFSILTKIIHYHRAYLLNKEKDFSKYDVLGEIEEPIDLNEIDIKILKIIQNNARLNSIGIAEKIKSTERIVRYRLQNLIKNKVIIGFRAHLDLDKLGINYYKIHFKLKNSDEKKLKEIENYIDINPNTVYRTNSIGGWDLEVELQVPSSKKLYEFIDCFAKEFKESVEDYETLEYDKEYSLSYLNQI